MNHGQGTRFYAGFDRAALLCSLNPPEDQAFGYRK